MKTELAEAKLALEAAEGLLNARRSDKDNPARLERRLKKLIAERDTLNARIESIEDDLASLDDLFEQARALVHRRAQEYKRLKHKAKIERLKKLKEQLDAASDFLDNVEESE